MSRSYQTSTWRLEIPETWSVEDQSGQALVTFHGPDGIGLLRVITGGEEALAQYVGEEFHGQVPGRTWMTTSGDAFTRTWLLACNGHRVWVTYSCAAKNADRENPEVELILRTMSQPGRTAPASRHDCDHETEAGMRAPQSPDSAAAKEPRAADTFVDGSILLAGIFVNRMTACLWWLWNRRQRIQRAEEAELDRRRRDYWGEP